MVRGIVISLCLAVFAPWLSSGNASTGDVLGIISLPDSGQQVVDEVPSYIRELRLFVPGYERAVGVRLTNYKLTPIEAGVPELLTTADSNYCPSCDSLVQLANVSSFRGNQIATVVVYEQCIDAETGLIYGCEDITYELVTAPATGDRDVCPRQDYRTLQVLRRLVDNPESVQLAGKAQRSSIAATMPDSIPMVIITSSDMKPAFEGYAVYKTRKGTQTLVQTVSAIQIMYPADDVQKSIRDYIRYCYNNLHTDWVLLGGDVDVIPFMKCWALGERVPSDVYYSNLDYEWNENGDDQFADLLFRGDTVDYVGDVFIGRLPCSNAIQAEGIISKIITYECRPADSLYQINGLFTGTNIVYGDEVGPDYPQHGLEVLDSAWSFFPDTYERELYYKSPSAAVKAAFSNGHGIVVNCSQSQAHFNFLTNWRKDYWLRDPIDVSFFDNDIANEGRYSIFFNYTCRNNALDSAITISRSFMQNPTAGGVAYLGSTVFDFPLNRAIRAFHRETFYHLFELDVTQVGEAITYARTILAPPIPHLESTGRYGYFSYVFLGDPQTRIWTDTPSVMSVTAPDTVYTGIRPVPVHVTSDGQDVSDALVCLWYPDETFPEYYLDYTDNTGWVNFNVPFVLEGTASIVASKQNYFVAEDNLTIIYPPDTSSGGGGCPTLYVWDGREYRFVNNVLAHSEDELSNDYDDDFYPVYFLPVVNGTVKLRVAELEDQKSWLKSVSAKAIVYDNSQRLAYTHNGDFALLSDETFVPTRATLNGETDVTQLLVQADGRMVEASGAGSLELRYVDPNRLTKDRATGIATGDSGGGGIIVDPGEKEIPPLKLVASTGPLDKNISYVYALTETGNWELVYTVYPRYRDMLKYIDLDKYFIGPDLVVKIEWTGSFSADVLPFYRFSDEELNSVDLQLATASHTRVGDVYYLADKLPTTELTLEKGEAVDITFDAPTPPRGKSVAIAFGINGKYETVDGLSSGSDVVFHQNFPNPFNPSTTFSFSIASPEHVRLEVYNVLGQLVAVVTDRKYSPGVHSVEWHGTDNSGSQVASGLYFARLKAGEEVHTRKMMLLR